MSKNSDVKFGIEFMSQLLGADFAAQGATRDIILDKTNEAIDSLEICINNLKERQLDPERLKGFVAEEWHAETFNIDAVRQGSSHRAWTPNSTDYGSVDIETNFGKKYSLKYYNVAKQAENAQAAIDKNTGAPKYHNQERLIAEEQLDEAKHWAKRRTFKNADRRPDLSEAHRETGDNLVGRVSDDEGVESKELSIKESKQISKEVNKGKFKAEDHGFEKVQINYIGQAIKAGLTAASINAIMQMVPELFKAVDYLEKNGEINTEELKASGEKILSSSAEAFLRGAITYSVVLAISTGKFGEELQKISPPVVGVFVNVILGTVKDSILVASGKMSSSEMGTRFVDTLVMSSGYLIGREVGGVIGQALFPELPIIGYAIGSMLGCSIAAVYNIGKKKLISFCVDTGFSCFGLVEQNYELPEDVLKKIGVDVIDVQRTQVSRTNLSTVSTTNFNTQIQKINYETVDITVLRRGVIGVNKVGYTY